MSGRKLTEQELRVLDMVAEAVKSFLAQTFKNALLEVRRVREGVELRWGERNGSLRRSVRWERVFVLGASVLERQLSVTFGRKELSESLRKIILERIARESSNRGWSVEK